MLNNIQIYRIKAEDPMIDTSIGEPTHRLERSSLVELFHLAGGDQHDPTCLELLVFISNMDWQPTTSDLRSGCLNVSTSHVRYQTRGSVCRSWRTSSAVSVFDGFSFGTSGGYRHTVENRTREAF